MQSQTEKRMSVDERTVVFENWELALKLPGKPAWKSAVRWIETPSKDWMGNRGFHPRVGPRNAERGLRARLRERREKCYCFCVPNN